MAKPHENFLTKLTLDDVWGEDMREGVNTAMNEGAQAMAADGSWIACTACNRRDDGWQGGCDLYWSQSKNGIWTPLKPFSAVINSPSWELQPTISADGKSIVFTSDRPWRSGRPRPLDHDSRKRPLDASRQSGRQVNSAGNDHLPFLHPDGQTLYFTSDGRPGVWAATTFISAVANPTEPGERPKI